MHLAAQLTRSSWAPTISLGSEQNIGLHSTGARANVVLLTYLLKLIVIEPLARHICCKSESYIA